MPQSTIDSDPCLFLGASWYPEMWPESDWPADVQKMRQVGFNIVRMFEFAWHRLEPAEGEFDFAWARHVMDLCHEAGIAVMVGTPTAAPPAWLTGRYPQVLRTDADGRVATHGMRKHYSVYSAEYRRHCVRIVERMAAEFAQHPALHSWQIDNEMGGSDHSERARLGFHEWLRRRFGTIEELNRTFGLEFWSQAYDDFSQIPLPIASVGSVEVPERHHPSLIIAAARYNSDAWTDFIKVQWDAIRAKSDKPITTNMTAGLGMHWFQHNKLLDRVGWSTYRDLNHYNWTISQFDRTRAEKPATSTTGHRPYWLLETAPSWSAGGKMWNIHHDGRGIRAYSWYSVLMGGSMVLYWQWRQHWAGQEMQHGTLVTATGRWRPNREAIAQLGREFAQHGQWLLDHPPAPAKVALLLSNEAAWGFSIDPIDEDMRYEVRWREDYHLPLARAHLWRDVIDETADFSRYRVLLMPLMPLLRQDTRANLRAWVEAGGLLLLGPLTGYRTEDFSCFRDREFGGLEELMGADSSISFTVHWVEDRTTVDFAEGASCRTKNWCEGFTPKTARAMAHYRGGYGDGHAAVLDNTMGKGRVITLGCRVSEETYLSLVRTLCSQGGIAPVANGSPQVVVVPRGGRDAAPAGWGVANLSESPQKVTLPAGGTDRLTGQRVGPELSLDPLQVAIVEAGRGGMV